MDSVLEWLKTWDWNALLAVIISFASVYGGSVIALIIGLIKSRLKNINFQESLEKTKIQLSKEQKEQIDLFQQKLISRLEALELNIIQNNNEANQERIKVLKDALEDADKITAEVSVISIEEAKDANAILNELE